MSYGIGVDIIDNERVERLVQLFPERFPRRILTPSEWSLYRQAPTPSQFLAKRFAAKEAFVKALGIGMRQGLSFQDITIHRSPLGKPTMECHGVAKQLIVQNKITTIHLSLSDEKQFSIAFVVLE